MWPCRIVILLSLAIPLLRICYFCDYSFEYISAFAELGTAKKSRVNDMAMLLIKPVVVCSPLPFIVCNLNTSGTWAPVLGDDNRTVVIALGVSGALRFLWCWSLEFYEIQPGFILGCVCLKCLCWEPLLPY